MRRMGQNEWASEYFKNISLRFWRTCSILSSKDNSWVSLKNSINWVDTSFWCIIDSFEKSARWKLEKWSSYLFLCAVGNSAFEETDKIYYGRLSYICLGKKWNQRLHEICIWKWVILEHCKELFLPSSSEKFTDYRSRKGSNMCVKI